MTKNILEKSTDCRSHGNFYFEYNIFLLNASFILEECPCYVSQNQIQNQLVLFSVLPSVGDPKTGDTVLCTERVLG